MFQLWTAEYFSVLPLDDYGCAHMVCPFLSFVRDELSLKFLPVSVFEKGKYTFHGMFKEPMKCGRYFYKIQPDRTWQAR